MANELCSLNIGNTTYPISPKHCYADTTISEIYPLGVTSNNDYSATINCVAGVKFVTGNKVHASAGFFETSDERLKDFIDDISVDFEVLKRIPKKYFTWKENKEMGVQIGTSAQEIEKHFPMLVSTSDDIKNVAYDKLSIIALAAIDKLYEENKQLKEKLDKLEKMIKNE